MQKLADAREVQKALTEMAGVLINDFADRSPLFVCLLRGAAPFAMQLMMEMTRQAPDFHPELDYMTVKTYGNERTASQPQIIMDLDPKTALAGRPVIVLDDVLDSGVTAQFVAEVLQQRGASETSTAVLVEKNIKRSALPHATYACFTAGSEWLAGMGMDDHATVPEAYRWSDEIIILN